MERPRSGVVREVVVATPVRSARAWTTALAPNRRGGWNFITQIYDSKTNQPPQFVVVDLSSGQTTTVDGVPGAYANSNYQVSEQLRAPNGRIFFPQLGNHLAYYDPETEQVKQLGQIVTSPEDKAIYRIVFGPDGKLYGGTQSNERPTIFEVDPETLAHRVLGKVGGKRNGYSYAYYLASDPPWLYVVVGQDPWELVALDTRTGQSRTLATRPADGFIELEVVPEGVVAKLVSKLRTPDQQSTRVWCEAGQLLTAAPRRTRSLARVPARNLVNAPELDLSQLKPDADGIGRLRWRPPGASRWRETLLRAARPEAITIDSLIALADGSLFGSVEQYHGFFRFYPRDQKLEHYDGLRVSGGPRVVVGKHVYFAGYPKSALYAYEPARAWNPAGNPANPVQLGSFEAAGTHYAYFMVPGASGRLYFAGRRERVGRGGGVGYFEPASNEFAGTHEGLASTTPRGLIVFGNPERLVYSGRDDGGRDAQLIVYSSQLRELERIRVMPGLKSTGELYATSAKNVILGISAEDGLAYRFDLATRKLLGTRKLEGIVAATAQRLDDSLWLIIGNSLARLDANTLELDLVGTVTPGAAGDLLVWQSNRLYRTRGGNIYEIVLYDADTR